MKDRTIFHFRHQGQPWTLCGSIEAPYYIEGDETAVRAFLAIAEADRERACSVCLEKIEDPGKAIDLPYFEFTELECSHCEEHDDYVEPVPILVGLDTSGGYNDVRWLRCTRCGGTAPCSEDAALEAADAHQVEKDNEAREAAGLWPRKF
jgi:hypothetical protein